MFNFEGKKNRKANGKNARKADYCQKRRTKLNWEGQLEDRRLLAKFDGFGQLLSNKLIELQQTTLPQTALINDLPAFGDEIRKASSDKLLFNQMTMVLGSIVTNTDSSNDVATALQDKLGSSITINSVVGDMLNFQLHGKTSLSINKFDAGIPILGFKSSNAFSANLMYTLNARLSHFDSKLVSKQPPG